MVRVACATGTRIRAKAWASKLGGLGVIDTKSLATYTVKLYTALVTVFTTLLTIQGKEELAAPTAGENE